MIFAGTFLQELSYNAYLLFMKHRSWLCLITNTVSNWLYPFIHIANQMCNELFQHSCGTCKGLMTCLSNLKFQCYIWIWSSLNSKYEKLLSSSGLLTDTKFVYGMLRDWGWLLSGGTIYAAVRRKCWILFWFSVLIVAHDILSSLQIMVSKTSMLKHFLQRQVIVRGQDCLAGLNFVILTFTDSETLPLVWGGGY